MALADSTARKQVEAATGKAGIACPFSRHGDGQGGASSPPWKWWENHRPWKSRSAPAKAQPPAHSVPV